MTPSTGNSTARRTILVLSPALLLLWACDGSTLEPDVATGHRSTGQGQSLLGAAPFSPGIAFTSDRSSERGTRELFVMRPDGSNPVRVTTGQGWTNAPAWSPDRQHMAFSRGGDIFIAHADGSMFTRLTNPEGLSEDWDPTWSPDGHRIAFARDVSGWFEFDIHVIDADGSNLTRLTTDEGGVGTAWSPDGTLIADAWFDIFVIHPDGTGRVNLTHSGSYDFSPAWSPDGERIAFVSTRDGNREIYVMNADGSNPVNLTRDPAFDAAPTWSPDGERIAFATNRDRNGEIYVMSADGSNPVNLTNHPADDWNPAW